MKITKKKMNYIKKVWSCKKESVMPHSVVIKLGTECNLRCKYCYVDHSINKKAIEEELVEKLFDDIMFNTNNRVECVFHGGEPLLYFSVMKRIVEKLSEKEYANRITYSFQTNASLFTQEIIDFVKEHKISFGISIDGPKEINDKLRLNAIGDGSYDSVMNGIELVRKNGLNFGVLSVLTNENVDEIEKICLWAKENSISMIDFKPYFPNKYGVSSLDIERYANAMCKAIDWQIRNNTKEFKLIIREIEMYMNLILKKSTNIKCYDSRSMCDHLNCNAGREHITVDVNGDVYICDRLYGNSEYVIGNLINSSIVHILKNEKIKYFSNRQMSHVVECNECNYNRICFLGCPATNILENEGEIEAVGKKPKYCTYFKRVIEKLYSLIDNDEYKKLIVEYKNGGKDEF